MEFLLSHLRLALVLGSVAGAAVVGTAVVTLTGNSNNDGSSQATIAGEAEGTETALAARIHDAMAVLAEGFEPGEPAAFQDMLAEHPEARGEALFGQLLYMRRHFDRSAWFFGADALANPSSAAGLNNFASLLQEVYLDRPEGRSDDWPSLSVAVLRQARELDSQNPDILNNLGRALVGQWRVDPDAVDLDEAVELLQRARDLGGEELVVLGNLALALDAAGDAAGAAQILNEMHMALSSHPTFLSASGQVSNSTQQTYAGLPRTYCNVNFRCSEVCPPSIIGRINLISCEIDQTTAQQNCQAGQPYPERYDCVGELPEFGVQIPGIDSGFSISTPFGSIGANTDGDGNVRWRIEVGPNFGPVNPYMRTDGRYNPKGGWSRTQFRGGVKFNLVNNNTAGRITGRWGYQPAYVQVQAGGTGATNISAGAYGNATVIG